MTILFYNLIIENKIIIFCLLSHSIYLTQFLDIEVFQLFKYYYLNTINKVV